MTLQAGAKLMRCAGEEHGAACGDTCGGGFWHGQIVNLSRGKNPPQALGEALHAMAHLREEVDGGLLLGLGRGTGEHEPIGKLDALRQRNDHLTMKKPCGNLLKPQS